MNSQHRHAQFESVGQQRLANQITFIQEEEIFPAVYHDGDIMQLPKLVRPGTQPVLCLDTNKIDVEYIVEQLEPVWSPGDYFLLTWDASNTSDLPYQSFWPFFFFQQRFVQRRMTNQTEKNWRISCLSGFLRHHRLELFRNIKPKVRSDDVVVVNRLNSETFLFENKHRPEIIDLVDSLPWASRPEFLDQDQTFNCVFPSGPTHHPAYQACFNITNETMGRYPGTLVTEKTWKAYRAGCVAVNYGCNGVDEYLQKTGFQVWEPAVGLDFDSKINFITELFDRDDLYDVYQQQLDAVQYNIDRFYSRALLREICDSPLQKIENWLNHK